MAGATIGSAVGGLVLGALLTVLGMKRFRYPCIPHDCLISSSVSMVNNPSTDSNRAEGEGPSYGTITFGGRLATESQ